MNYLKAIKKSINQLIRIFKKSSIWFKIVVIIIAIVLIMHVFRDNNRKEGFKQGDKFVLKENSELYDKFYCSIYDELVNDPMKNEFEITQIDNITKINKKSKVLDIGSGTGHHVGEYTKKGIDIEGIDKSKNMIIKAKKKYKKGKFRYGDVMSSITYPERTFTHILCLYFTIYEIKNKSKFFKNVYDWLKPGGNLIIHLVNRDQFDTIINAGNPLLMVSPQKYAKERIQSSVVKFNNFTYKNKIDIMNEKNMAKMEETFIDDNSKNVRKNIHTSYSPTQKEILKKAKNVGFILNGKVDMVHCQYEYQYLYILKKPE